MANEVANEVANGWQMGGKSLEGLPLHLLQQFSSSSLFLPYLDSKTAKVLKLCVRKACWKDSKRLSVGQVQALRETPSPVLS